VKTTETGDQSAALETLTELLRFPSEEARNLVPTQVAALRALFEDKKLGLYLFARYIFGYTDLTEDLHLPICMFISRWGETTFTDGTVLTEPPNELHERAHGEIIDNHRRLMVCIPRECFKTSLCTRANTLWTLARNPDATVGLFNEKAENAQRWTGAIAKVVESSHLFQMLWREMIPRGVGFWDREQGVTRNRGLKWGDSGVLFERGRPGIPELSIEPHGVGGATTGKHFTHMVLDDIIGRAAAYSQAEMQTAMDWVDNQRPLERPAENGCELVVHTPWAYADVYAHKLKKWGDYKVHRRHLLEDSEGKPDRINGRSIFPTKISTKKAKQLLKTDFFVNMAQYQCQPMASRDQSFDDAWFRECRIAESGSPYIRVLDEFYDPEICDPESQESHAPQVLPLHWLNKAIILDPAPAKPSEIKREPKANNGIVVVGVDPWGRRYCLESAVARVGPTELLDLIMGLCDKWGTMTVAIEEVAFSAIYAPLWTTIARFRYEWEPDFVSCFTKGRDKQARIKQNLIRVFENGFWYFNEHGTGKLRQELSEFPNSETVDLADALSYTDEVLERPRTPSQTESHLHSQRNLDANRGLTGYGYFQEGEDR
jgi:hypothetical protein